jgi:hypothetical protein
MHDPVQHTPGNGVNQRDGDAAAARANRRHQVPIQVLPIRYILEAFFEKRRTVKVKSISTSLTAICGECLQSFLFGTFRRQEINGLGPEFRPKHAVYRVSARVG